MPNQLDAWNDVIDNYPGNLNDVDLDALQADFVAWYAAQ